MSHRQPIHILKVNLCKKVLYVDSHMLLCVCVRVCFGGEGMFAFLTCGYKGENTEGKEMLRTITAIPAWRWSRSVGLSQVCGVCISQLLKNPWRGANEGHGYQMVHLWTEEETSSYHRLRAWKGFVFIRGMLSQGDGMFGSRFFSHRKLGERSCRLFGFEFVASVKLLSVERALAQVSSWKSDPPPRISSKYSSLLVKIRTRSEMRDRLHPKWRQVTRKALLRVCNKYFLLLVESSSWLDPTRHFFLAEEAETPVQGTLLPGWVSPLLCLLWIVQILAQTSSCIPFALMPVSISSLPN